MFIVGGCIILFIARIMSDSLDHMYRLAIDDQLKEKSSQYKILFEEKMESDLQMIYAITSFIELNDSNDMQQLAEKLYESNAKTSFLRMGYFNKDGNGIKVTADGSYECDITQDTICKEVQMYLQPKVDLKTKKVVSAEALVRWITDEKQTIFPDEFIPLFEENTFCIQLDLYMVEKACKQLREWIDAGYNPISISVNQTKLLFYEEGYVETLCEITEKYGIHPKYITLEILEGLAHKNVKQLNACIGRLRTFGFRISMDDFGSGFSSLNTLAKLQIDELKLDRNFLIKATEKQDSSQYVILESIIEMAKKLHIDTVAEGVETSLDEQMLRSLQCDFGQGYFYSRPLPTKEFTQKFVSNN